MGNWDFVHACPNCGRESGQKIKCEDCGTLGCDDCVGQYNYKTSWSKGEESTETRCNICNNMTKKRHI